MQPIATEQMILMYQATRAAMGDRDIFLIQENIFFLTMAAPSRLNLAQGQDSELI